MPRKRREDISRIADTLKMYEAPNSKLKRDESGYVSKNKFKSKSKETKALNKVDVKRLLADRNSFQPLASLNLLSCIMLEKPATQQLGDAAAVVYLCLRVRQI